MKDIVDDLQKAERSRESRPIVPKSLHVHYMCSLFGDIRLLIECDWSRLVCLTSPLTPLHAPFARAYLCVRADAVCCGQAGASANNSPEQWRATSSSACNNASVRAHPLTTAPNSITLAHRQVVVCVNEYNAFLGQ